jgi:hypothetical protein
LVDQLSTEPHTRSPAAITIQIQAHQEMATATSSRPHINHNTKDST